ncbi:MAG TPA: HepT-like ribonuclease domain-containing protein [Longimicrobium sp.]|jgi:uncharacterized protein YutE (UPF0331/DUF86 family)
MTYLVERLLELRKHLDHLHKLRPRVRSAANLERDLSLHNDVLFSLIRLAQLVIDIAGELGSRKGLRYDDYTEAVRNLHAYPEFPDSLVERLTPIPGFRNVLLHEYVNFDLDRAVAALRNLQPVEDFLQIVAEIESDERGGNGSTA